MLEGEVRFFTEESVLSISGATLAVVVVTNGLRQAFGWAPAWLGLIIAQLLALAGALSQYQMWLDIVIAVLNGFLIYMAALGSNEVARQQPSRPRLSGPIPASRRDLTRRQRFFAPWF